MQEQAYEASRTKEGSIFYQRGRMKHSISISTRYLRATAEPDGSRTRLMMSGHYGNTLIRIRYGVQRNGHLQFTRISKRAPREQIAG